MKPHKHAELIKAWADGAEIEYRDRQNPWGSLPPYGDWDDRPDFEYRIKPESKPDITKSFLLESHPFAGFRFTEEYENTRLPRQQWIRAVFNGETGELKSVEIL